MQRLWLFRVSLSPRPGGRPASRPVASSTPTPLWVGRRGKCWPRGQGRQLGTLPTAPASQHSVDIRAQPPGRDKAVPATQRTAGGREPAGGTPRASGLRPHTVARRDRRERARGQGAREPRSAGAPGVGGWAAPRALEGGTPASSGPDARSGRRSCGTNVGFQQENYALRNYCIVVIHESRAENHLALRPQPAEPSPRPRAAPQRHTGAVRPQPPGTPR